VVRAAQWEARVVRSHRGLGRLGALFFVYITVQSAELLHSVITDVNYTCVCVVNMLQEMKKNT
jgi:hypothetical protein